IAGEGGERPKLEGQIRALGLEGEVELLGRRSDVYSLYEEAAFLVLPSRFEGFGMVLVEAMSFGCPVVAFDCPCGPAEVVRDGVDGLLVPNGDVGALAGAMERMMSDEALRDSLGRAGTDARVRFGIDTVSAMWRAIFNEALAPYGKR
ncbi:MAG TPA: glycosyltransferase, partial [Spirochaetales bacterium]|nr:glycosyltransferase [Spirochaetales bacterium]